MGVSQAPRSGRAGAAARRRLRRRALGGADVPRPRRAHWRPFARRADPAPLRRAPRAAREEARLGRRPAERGPSVALAPEERDADARLTIPVRKDLIRPERATFPGEDAYRFRHLLIRDAAYDALPKATRVELHERFAAWLDERGTDLVEQDEIVGYPPPQA